MKKKTTTTLTFKIDSIFKTVDEVFDPLNEMLAVKEHSLVQMSPKECNIVVCIKDTSKPYKDVLPPIIDEISKIFEVFECKLYTGTVSFTVSKEWPD